MKPSDLLTALGQTKSLTKWAIDLGCTVQALLGRLARGWDADRTVSTPAAASPSKGINRPAETLTVEQSMRLLEVCGTDAVGIRNKALIVIGWRSGIRISEAIALEPKDLDREKQTVRILHGKGDKARTIGLDTQAWSVVQAWLDHRASLSIDQHSKLFCTIEGGQLSDRYVRALMGRLAKAAGITKRVHYHGLRHTMASELAAEGVPMNLIQQQLGHSSLAVTSKYVSSINPAETVNAMRKRNWSGPQQLSYQTGKDNPLPPPDWLNRMRADIGDRLHLLHDARTDEQSFKAIVVLY